MQKGLDFSQEFPNGILNFGSLCQDCAWFQGVLQIDAGAMVDVSNQTCASVKVEKLLVIVETQDPWKIQVQTLFKSNLFFIVAQSHCCFTRLNLKKMAPL